MNNRLKTLTKGIADVSPLMIPVVPFGIIFGVIGMELGLSAYMTFGMSVIIFGGASQIVLLQLFSGGASSLVAITSVGAVNSRHLLYGAVFSEYLSHLKLTWKIILSYILIDQAFAVSNTYFKKNKENEFKHYHLLGAGFTCWTIWQISTILGIVLGSVVPEELGLSFTISLTFLALLINDFRKFKNIIVMMVSGIVATIGYNAIPFQAYIIVAALSALLVATLLTLINLKKKIMHWSTIIYCGMITYLTRFSMIFLLKEDILNDKTKKVLSYVPSAIFPAIIFPPIFLDSAGSLDIESNPKIFAAILAIIVGYMSRSILVTIFVGLISYWFLIFVYYQ